MSDSFVTYESSPTDGQFTFKERLGMVFIVQVSFLSLIATSSVLFYYLYSFIVSIRNPSQPRPSTHIHHYFMSLMVADLIQSLGGILNIQWIMAAGVEENAICTTQGALKQVGNVAVAMSTLVIAIHTARVLIFKIHFPSIVPKLVLGFIWAFAGVMLAVGFGMHAAKDIQFYGNTGFWCWITEDYAVQRITLEYLWLWVAALGNIVCYVAIFFVIRGYVHFDRDDNTMRFQTSTHSFNITSGQMPSSNRTSAIARQMLFYPAVYLVCIVPMTVSRFLAFAGTKTPFGVTVFSSLMFSSSGLFNVILFKITRPSLLPQPRPGMGFHTKSHPPVEVSVHLEAYKHTSSPGTASGEYAREDSHSYPPHSSSVVPISFGSNRRADSGSPPF